MENQYTEEERYYKAKKRVEEIKGFYGNLISYIVVNCFLIVLNLITSHSIYGSFGLCWDGGLECFFMD